MTKRLNLSIGELAFLASVVDGSHPTSFWADQSRFALANKLRDAAMRRMRKG